MTWRIILSVMVCFMMGCQESAPVTHSIEYTLSPDTPTGGIQVESCIKLRANSEPVMMRRLVAHDEGGQYYVHEQGVEEGLWDDRWLMVYTDTFSALSAIREADQGLLSVLQNADK